MSIYKKMAMFFIFIFFLSFKQGYSCDCFEKKTVFGDMVIDLGDQVIFPGIDENIDPNEIFERNLELNGVLSRKEMILKISFHYKEAKKELTEAKKILEKESLFFGKIESLWTAATAGTISVICGKPAPIWSSCVIAIITFVSQEIYKFLKDREAWNYHIGKAKENALEVDYWLYMLVYHYGC